MPTQSTLKKILNRLHAVKLRNDTRIISFARCTSNLSGFEIRWVSRLLNFLKTLVKLRISRYRRA